MCRRSTNGIGEAQWILGFATPSDFVRTFPEYSECLSPNRPS